MSINLIAGLMGSGKSYEATKNSIVKNYSKGRHIITNMKGLNLEKIKEYCIKVLKKKEEDLGKITIVNDEQVKSDNFFPYLTEEDNKEVQHYENSIVKPGDLIIIDEALNFWAKGKKLKDLDYTFFRMHRHFVSPETNLTCDLVVIVQDGKLLHPELKNLVEMAFHCKKLNSLGLQTHYRVIVYDGNTMTTPYKIANDTHKYDKEIFPLYKSHAGDNAKEVKVDDRTNIFKNKKLWLIIAFFILTIPFAIYKLNQFFHPIPKDKDGNPIATPTNTNNVNAIQANTNEVQVAKSQFRIVGVLDTPKKRLVYLEDENGNMKIVFPQNCNGSGLTLVCKIDNIEISYYSNLRSKKLENKNNETRNIN